MFKRIAQFFNDLGVGRKLGVGFGLLVFLAFLIGAVAYITSNTQGSAFDKSATASEKVDLADHVQINLLEARRREKDFLLRHTTQGFDTAYNNYIVVNHQAVQDLLTGVQSLRDSSPTPQELQLLQQIESSAHDYETELDEVVSLIKDRGFQDTGLEGQFRADVHAVEAAIPSDTNVTITYLQMRRNEKDYLLRGDQTYIDAVQTDNAQLQNEIQALDISQADKNNLLTLAGGYLDGFNALVEADRVITEKTDSFRAHAEAISPLVETYVGDKYTESIDALDQFHAVERTTRIVNAAILVLALVTGLGLTWLISRLLVRQVAELDRVFSDVRIGDFGSRARIFGKDELGRATDGVNAMLGQMTNLLTAQAAEAQERVRTLAVLGWAWETDAEGRYTYCSENVSDVLGYTTEEMVGKTLFDLMFPEEAARIAPLFAEMASKKQSITDLENWNQHKEGNAVCFQTVGVPVLDANGDLTGYRGANKDITENKQAEQEQARLSQQNELILNTAGEGLYGLDAQGNVAFVNPAALAMDGYTAQELIGKHHHQLLHHTKADGGVNPEEECPIHATLQDGVSRRLEDELFWRKDGTRLPVELICNPIIEQDKITGVVISFRDITERQQAEAERDHLLDEMSRMKAMLDNNRYDFVGISDLQAKGLYINEAGLEMVGYPGTDPTQLSINAFYSPDEYRRFNEQIMPVVMEKGSWAGEAALRHRSGTIIPVQQVITLVWDKVGNPQAIGTICRDLREQKRIVLDVENAAAQVTHASTSMTEVVQLMADQASSSAHVAEQAATRAQEGDRIVSETIASMSRIRDNTQETAQRIKRLGEVSQEIGEAVRLIEEIADRTTVLALNASIQAAVAGEAGRGFAVVAEEVQRLAERASGATRKIEGLIKSIQAETNQAVIGIEESTREVVDGSQLAQKAGERMSELNQLVAQLANLIQQVAETTSKQTGASMTSLVELSQGLQESVAAFGLVEDTGGNGNRPASPRPTTSRN